MKEEQIKQIIRRISDAAISLAIVRHGLTNDRTNYPDGQPYRLILSPDGFDDDGVEKQLQDEFIDSVTTVTGQLFGFSLTILSSSEVARLKAENERLMKAMYLFYKLSDVVKETLETK